MGLFNHYSETEKQNVIRQLICALQMLTRAYEGKLSQDAVRFNDHAVTEVEICFFKNDAVAPDYAANLKKADCEMRFEDALITIEDRLRESFGITLYSGVDQAN